MAEEIPKQTEEKPAPKPEEQPEDKGMHPAERRKLEKELSESRKRLAELENAGKSEMDKLRSEHDALKPKAAELERYQEALRADVESHLEGLSKEAKKQLAPVLENLAPLDQMRVIRAFAANQPKETPNPTVARQPPARTVQGLPRSIAEFSAGTFQQRQAWASLAAKEGVDLQALPAT